MPSLTMTSGRCSRGWRRRRRRSGTFSGSSASAGSVCRALKVADAGPELALSCSARMANRFTGLLEIDLSQSAWRSFYPGITDSDFAVIAAGFRQFRVIDLQNCK
ncbi:hypothetical protein BHM03_00058123, partial [Ensete ventricosum]